LARRAFDWFLGANTHAAAVYDPAAGTCAESIAADGSLGAHTATATLAFLGALLCLVSVEEVRLSGATADLGVVGAAAPDR
jgi:hypothetical protein